jgi:hypothetical protein
MLNHPNTHTPLLSKETTDSPQYAILLWVIGMIFTGDLEDCRESGCVGVDSVSYSIGNLEGISVRTVEVT